MQRSFSTRTRRALLALLTLLLLQLPAVAARAGGGFLASGWGAPGPDLEADLPSGQLIGTAITWTVTPPADGTWDQRFTVRRLPFETTVLRDFGPRERFEWTPEDEGIYWIEVASRERSSGEVRLAGRLFRVVAPPEDAAVLPTRNPLVALVAAHAPALPDCTGFASGCRMRVVFQGPDDPAAQATAARPVDPIGLAMGFYVAGLRERTLYRLRQETLDAAGHVLAAGPVLGFETGSVAAALPAASVRIPRADGAPPAEPLVLVSAVLGPAPHPYATDLEGHVVWYDDTAEGAVVTHVVAGGTRLELIRGDEMREVDLVGNVIRSTTRTRLNQQLEERGEEPLATLHHEVLRLPDGSTALLGSVVRDGTNPQGTGPMPVIGDVVLVLDRDLQVAWTWNAFDHLDVARGPTLDDVCVGTGEGTGLCSTPLGVRANDWMHSNALVYAPQDGSLLVSVRHQDWIVKVDYADGKGPGDVVWRLGPGGDFSIDSGDPFPWFSHQHGPSALPGGGIAVYDNGNTRCALGFGCESRGQVYDLDEARMQAHLELSIPLGYFSFFLGNAQMLRGGGYHFGSGAVGYLGQRGSTAEEVADGAVVYSLFQSTFAYRSFRLRDLYTPPPGPEPEQDDLPAPEPLF